MKQIKQEKEGDKEGEKLRDIGFTSLEALRLIQVVICAALCYFAKVKPRTSEIPDIILQKILHTPPTDTVVVFGRDGT